MTSHTRLLLAQEMGVLQRIDSLERVLAQQHGVERYETLLRLCWEYCVRDPKRAIEYGRQADALGKRYGIQLHASRVERLLGLGYCNLGDYGKAVEHFFAALTIDEVQNAHSAEAGHSLSSIGRVFILQSNPSEALKYLEQAQTIAEKSHDTALLAHCLLYRGDALYLQHQYSESLASLLRALPLWENLDIPTSTAINLSSIGRVYNAQQQWNKALEYYTRALDLAEKNRQEPEASAIRVHIASVLLVLGNIEKAEYYAEQAYISAQHNGSWKHIQGALQILAEISIHKQEHAKALRYHRLLAIATDSVYSEEAMRQTAIYAARYDHERKVAQLAQLEKDKHMHEHVRNVSIACAALLAILLVVVANRYYVKQKAEHMLELRAAELVAANDELRKAQFAIEEQNRMLRDLDMERNELLRVTAQDLKNLVSSMYGVAEMLQHGEHKPEQIHTLSSVILDNTRQMFELITNIVDINAIESGMLELQRTVVDATMVVYAVIDRLEQSAHLKNIRLEVVVPEEHLYIIADSQALMQIIENLVSNAIKYSDFGQKVVVRLQESRILQSNRVWTREEWLQALQHQADVESEQAADGEGLEHCVRFEVQDSGPGLTEEDKAYLFTKFARLSARPTAGERSTGLGLSIVKKLTELLGGRVWCESVYGIGATFIVELPQATLEQVQKANHSVIAVNDVNNPKVHKSLHA
ncbi:MAG: tetratricopeptide repeat-containing sensor histidine kinase [Bacteroidota bacterium]|nr:tetratricopeptide repeat-containing sensor histidine kinase [Candidatus Kapabacteria bacterium]MDW8219170.1 tetratricopeptide repeat-containing sensor histidine kinase [Bacteroidota bacterium]